MKKVLAIRFLIISPDLKLVVCTVFMSFMPIFCRSCQKHVVHAGEY
jgi:hypothetical protein